MRYASRARRAISRAGHDRNSQGKQQGHHWARHSGRRAGARASRVGSLPGCVVLCPTVRRPPRAHKQAQKRLGNATTAAVAALPGHDRAQSRCLPRPQSCGVGIPLLVLTCPWLLSTRTPLSCPDAPPTQAGAFKIGDTAGTLDNIVACKLNREADPAQGARASWATCSFNAAAAPASTPMTRVHLGGPVWPSPGADRS
jgi:hypothetical protein